MDVFLDANGKKYPRPQDQPVFWRISGYALVEHNNQLLVVTPTWNTLYELPGGGIEPNEDVRQGIIRETWEETGYQIKIQEVSPFYFSEQKFYHRHHKKFYHSLIIIYQASLLNTKQDTTVINTHDGFEINHVGWYHLAHFTKKNTHWVTFPAITKLCASK